MCEALKSSEDDSSSRNLSNLLDKTEGNEDGKTGMAGHPAAAAIIVTDGNNKAAATISRKTTGSSLSPTAVPPKKIKKEKAERKF